MTPPGLRCFRPLALFAVLFLAASGCDRVGRSAGLSRPSALAPVAALAGEPIVGQTESYDRIVDKARALVGKSD